MRKLQQFFIIKISSDRLKDSRWKIKDLSLDQARLNGEVVSFSDSELIRTLFRIKNKEFSQSLLDGILAEKKKITSKKNAKANRDLLKELNKKIDDILYIPELISISFTDRRHYQNIIDRGGFTVNQITYLPFMASSGMVRRNSALFIDSRYRDQIAEIFDNGRNKDVEYTPAKFSAYFSLYASSSLSVTFPRIAVVPDFLIKTTRKVDYSRYVGDGIDPVVEEREMELECNAFDGQGLVSPDMAAQWASDMDLDYVPSAFIVRSSFLKGLVVVFDFHEFSETINNKNTTIKDIYGNFIDARNVDCIISESQFKLWNSYSSTHEYVDNCKKNGLGWGISRATPREEKTHAKSSYQFLQVLSLEDSEIEELCKPTLQWLENVSGGDLGYSLLYSLGDMSFDEKWFSRLDASGKALLLDNDLLKDSYIIDHLDKSITKKKKDACMGRLMFSGNYQFLISDPYAQCSHIFGMGLSPLLKEHEHYSQYWNKRCVKQVVGIRSPIVHSSEVDLFNFQSNDAVNHWFQYISSGIVIPAYGIGMDNALLGGADQDGDQVCTIDHSSFIRGRRPGLPIVYDTQKAPKVKLEKSVDGEVIASHVTGYNQKVGFLTNVSTALTSLLSSFSEGTSEHASIIQRLKYGRALQGLEIDKTKGLVIPPFPEHWVKWKKLTDEMKDEEKEIQRFYNSILADKRPYFMRWLYSHYNRKYLKERSAFDNISKSRWGISFSDLEKVFNRTEEQQRLIDVYRRKTFFIDNASTMNRISHHVEEKIKTIKLKLKMSSDEFDFMRLVSDGYRKPTKTNIDKMKILFKEFKSFKRDFRENYRDYDEGKFSSVEQITKYINQRAYATISSNGSELADLAVYLCYNVLGKTARGFAWQCFGDEIVSNIRSKHKEKFVRVPMKNPKGNIEYLWEKYSFYLINIED